MGEIKKGTAYSEANFVSCKSMKSSMLCASKIQWWGRYRIATPFHKKEVGKKRVTGPE